MTGPRTAEPGPLSCRALVELVTDYLEGTLPEGERARFEAHLSACDHCEAYVAQLRLTLDVMGRLEPEGLPPEIERELLHAFRTWKADG